MPPGGDKPPDGSKEEEEDEASELGEVEVDTTRAEEPEEPPTHNDLVVDDDSADRRRSNKSNKSVSVDPEPEVQLIPGRDLQESMTSMTEEEKYRFEEALAEPEPPSLTDPEPEESGPEPNFVSAAYVRDSADKEPARESSSPIVENNDVADDLETKYETLLRPSAEPDENQAITDTLTPNPERKSEPLHSVQEPKQEPEPLPGPEQVDYYIVREKPEPEPEPEPRRISEPQPEPEPRRKSDPQPEQVEFYIVKEPERERKSENDSEREPQKSEYYFVRQPPRQSDPEREPRRQSDPEREPRRQSDPEREPPRQSDPEREPRRSEPEREPEQDQYYMDRDPPRQSDLEREPRRQSEPEHEPEPPYYTASGTSRYPENDVDTLENQPEPYDEDQVTPEDIFDQLKISHEEHIDEDEGSVLQSYIIRKTYSSENVVILLNIKRLPDGEWVLDKTIAQGLKPQTYGGVVSIDRYGDDDAPLCREPEQPSSSQRATQSTPPESKIPSPSPSNLGDNCLWDSIKKLEDYIAVMNKEVQTARKLMKSLPVPPCTGDDEGGGVPPLEENANEAYNKCMQDNHSVPFDDLPFADKLTKMFNTMVYDEPCSLCDKSTDEPSGLSTWFKNVIGEIGDFFGSSATPSTGTSRISRASQAQSILTKSLEKLDEVQQSRLLEKLENSGMVAIVQPDKSIDAVIELPKLSLTTVPDWLGDDLPDMEWENEESTASKLGEEENSDLEMIKENKKSQVVAPEIPIEESFLPIYHDRPPSSDSLFLVNLEPESNLDTFISKHRNSDK